MNWKRAFLLLIALPAAGAAVAADKVKVVALEGSQLFPVQIMQTKGIAKKYGIDIDLMRVASPTASYTVMQTGDFHIGFGGWLSVAVLRAKGFKLSNVYSMVSYTNDVIVKAEAALLKAKAAGRDCVHAYEMTEQQRTALQAELESLKAQRPRILADLKRAMEDKDFRENAPLDAARAQQGYVEGRIRQIELTLDRAVDVKEQGPAPKSSVQIGSKVVLRNLSSGKEVSYTLVRSGDVNPGEGRISFESPVGRALLQHQAGDEVEVSAPSGTLRFRVERVEG